MGEASVAVKIPTIIAPTTLYRFYFFFVPKNVTYWFTYKGIVKNKDVKDQKNATWKILKMLKFFTTELIGQVLLHLNHI